MSSNQHLEIVPSNITSTGSLSYKNGQPTIQLLIGAQERYIVPGSIRLCGELTVKKNGNIIPLASDGIRMNERLGVHSVIDTLSIFSQRSGQNIETINHHNRMMSSYLSVTQSKADFACHSYESGLRFPNYKAQQLGVITNTQAASASGGDSPNSFCIPLVCGLFLGQDPIPLSNNWGVGGLNIEIQLSPDQNVLFSSTNSDTNLLDAFYELSNLKLICETIVPSVDELSQLMRKTENVMEYNAISSYYTSINSTNAIINFNLGLSKVLSVYMNFIPSSFINNLAQDGFQCLPLINNLSTADVAPIKQLVFTRGGLKLPLEYNLDANVREDSSLKCADPVIFRNFASAFMPFMSNKRSQINPNTNVRVIDTVDNYSDYSQGGQFFGIGVSYDQLSGDGEDFSNQNFGVAMDTGLTENNPHGVFLYVRSRQTLVMNQNGLQVLI